MAGRTTQLVLKQREGAECRAGQEETLLDYLQAPALGKPWHRKAPAVLGTKGHGGDDGVVPPPSTLQEQLCPGLIPAKGSGKCLGMARVSVVGCGLGT